jgi:predicted RNA-binding protein YlqC (UPF0109 family)
MNAKLPKRDLNTHLIDVCRHIVRSIVKNPDLIEVTYDDRREQLTILVSPEDRGIVIGRGGQNLSAIESCLALALTHLSGQESRMSRLVDLPSLEVRAAGEI